MAQTIQYYQTQITNAYVANAATIGIYIRPELWSVTNMDRCVIYAVAVCAYLLNSLFDLFKADVDETISAMKPHSLRWYALKAKAFQYGFSLVADADYYNNTGIDADVVAASKIVSNVAVTEQTRGLRIKVAKLVSSDLAPLGTTELAAFQFYMKQVKDAGVKLNITTSVADNLKNDITIIYNPLVLNASGERIDGTDPLPVQNAIRSFLKNLPFNGVFSIQKYEAKLLEIDGVTDLKINSISARYGLLPFANINISYTPDSGYMRIADADLSLNFLPQ
jgi:hypothetical protein